MLPHNHFLVAGLAISPIALTLFPEKSIGELGEWIVIRGVVSAAIDLEEYKKAMASIYQPIDYPGTKEWAAFLQREYKDYGDLIKELDIKI